jgi:hypothetical protein
MRKHPTLAHGAWLCALLALSCGSDTPAEDDTGGRHPGAAGSSAAAGGGGSAGGLGEAGSSGGSVAGGGTAGGAGAAGTGGTDGGGSDAGGASGFALRFGGIGLSKSTETAAFRVRLGGLSTLPIACNTSFCVTGELR